MNKNDYKNLWVYVEVEENIAKPVGFELLAPARKLADKMEQKLVAVVIGGSVEAIANDAIAYGADEVLLVEGEAREPRSRLLTCLCPAPPRNTSSPALAWLL